MKTIKLKTLLLIIVVGIVLGLVSQVSAGGSPAPGDECCVVINPGGGADAMKGTMALVYDPDDNYSLEITLRLQRSGEQKFFRLKLTLGFSIEGLSNEAIICLILNPEETNSSKIQESVTLFVNQILLAFFGENYTADNTRLVITSDSISNYQGVYECTHEDGSPVYCSVPGTTRISTLGDIVIYAVDRDKAKMAYPTCP